MKKLFLVAVLVVMALNACGPTPAPSPTPDFQATTGAQAAIMVAGTLTAQPTSTALPTQTLNPTETPTDQAVITQTATLTPTPQIISGPTLTPFQGTLAPGGVADYTAILLIQNEGSQGSFYIVLNGISLNGDKPVYYAYTVNRFMRLDIPLGNYTFNIKYGNHSYSGSFKIIEKDKRVIHVNDKKVYVTEN